MNGTLNKNEETKICGLLINKDANRIVIEYGSLDNADLLLVSEVFKDNSLPTHLSGIYFIFNKINELIYIGKSKEIRGRLRSHLGGFGKGFFKQTPQINPEEIYGIKYILFPVEELDLAEMIYLNIYHPYRNNFPWWREISTLKTDEENRETIKDKRLREMIEEDDD